MRRVGRPSLEQAARTAISVIRRARSSGVWAGLMLSIAVAIPLIALQVYFDVLLDPRHRSTASRVFDVLLCSLRPYLCDEVTLRSLYRSAVAIAMELAVFICLLGYTRAREHSGLRYFVSFVITFTIGTVMIDFTSFWSLFVLQVSVWGFA